MKTIFLLSLLTAAVISCVTADPHYREPKQHWLTLQVPGYPNVAPVFIHGFKVPEKKDPDFKMVRRVTGTSESRGKALYQKNCAACHGATGVGDGEHAKMLPKAPANLQALGKDLKWVDFFMKVSEGGDVMPAWKTMFDANQIHDLSVYIESLAKSAPAAPVAQQGLGDESKKK